ncbi:family 78 glycoside hydrolase catalytic domain [Nocardia sp. NPDC050697]|uniref:alpha-L-rhamnosidase n=1 Tax=Nocardia sp. NPDC050697 TaxID=3155158 RepID=UPI0033E913A7
MRDVAITRARVYATAHGLFELELNGRRVGDHELAPGWTAYESRLRYHTFDVTGLLRSGANAIGVRLADGWWRGHLGWDGRSALYGSDLAALVQLEIEYGDGDRAVIGSGPDWRAGTGPILTSDLYNGEHFDARLDAPGWSSPGFDDSGWLPVEAETFDTTVLVAPDGPPVRCVETVPVAEVLTTPSGATVLDFGQNLVGRLRITVTGRAGDTVVLRHAEVLENGEPAFAPLRTAAATDTYVLSGAGTETWAPRFTVHGFRYAQVEGWPGTLRPSDLVAEVLHTDMVRTGTFTVSDPLLQRLHDNVVWSMRGNFVDVPTDCPQRDERLGWTGDLQVFAPTAEFLYDCAGMLTGWLHDLAAEQRKYGGTPMIVPAVVMGYNGPMAGWGDAATVVPWSIYRAHGDEGILRTHFHSMRAWVEEVAAAAGADRIWNSGFQFGDWLDPTAPAGRPEQAATFPEIVATAYFARSARIVADTATLLDRAEDARRYRRLAEEVRDAFRHQYVTPSGRLLSDSPTAYALALQFDLLDGAEERGRAANRLAEIVRNSGYAIATGFLGTPLLCDALSAHGHADVAYRVLMRTEPPSWLYAVVNGATTIWERWDSLLPDGTINPSGMTSFNHYAFGSVADWLHRVVAGLAPGEPGYRSLLIAPQPPRRGLTSAGAHLDTPYGTAESAWELRAGQFHLTAIVPVGAHAEVRLPSGIVNRIEHGTHRWSEPFEVESDERGVVDVDTRLGDLMDHPDAMLVLTGVITKYIPEAAEHLSAGMRGQEDMTPRVVAGLMPRPDEVLADLERGFAAVSAGTKVPPDVFAELAPPAL